MNSPHHWLVSFSRWTNSMLLYQQDLGRSCPQGNRNVSNLLHKHWTLILIDVDHLLRDITKRTQRIISRDITAGLLCGKDRFWMSISLPKYVVRSERFNATGMYDRKIMHEKTKQYETTQKVVFHTQTRRKSRTASECTVRTDILSYNYVELPGNFGMWCCRRMRKICWTDHIRNEEVLLRVKEQRNILHEISKRKVNWIGHILRRNCLLQRVRLSHGFTAPRPLYTGPLCPTLE
jgi:hypothetical protein